MNEELYHRMYELLKEIAEAVGSGDIYIDTYDVGGDEVRMLVAEVEKEKQ